MEVLWLRPTSLKLLYGVVDRWRAGPNSIRGTLMGMQHRHRPAVRLKGQYGMGASSAGLEFSLTHFRSTVEQTADRGTNDLWGLLLHPNAIIDDNDVTNIGLHTMFDFNEASVGPRVSFGFGSRGNVSLSGGLQYTRLKQLLEIEYIQRVSSTSRRVVYLTRENTLSGVGPAFIVGTTWDFGGVNVFGEIGAAMLVSYIGGSVYEHDYPVGAVNGTIRVQVECPYGARVVPMASMKLGVAGNYQSNWGLFGISAGYEVRNYFNAVSTYEFYDDVDSQLGANDQSDIGLDGFFLRVQAQWGFNTL